MFLITTIYALEVLFDIVPRTLLNSCSFSYRIGNRAVVSDAGVLHEDARGDGGVGADLDTLLKAGTG